MSVVVVTATGFRMLLKKPIHDHWSKEEHELICIASGSVHAIKQIRLGFFQNWVMQPHPFLE